MPLYKGTAEVTGGGLYKGSTEIENGIKNGQFFYENLSTISWVAPTGQGMTYSVPTPQTQTKDGGLAIDTVTFTITNPLANIQGTVSISGLPPGLTFTQVNSGAGLGNTITITINGTMPQDSYFNTLLTCSGMTGSTNYNAHFLMCGGGGTGPGAAGGGVRTSYGSVSGGGAAAESQLAMVAGQDYTITVNQPTTQSESTSCSPGGQNPNGCPGGPNYVVWITRNGGSVSIVGGAINKTVSGGAAGVNSNPDPFSGNSAQRITSDGYTGGCGSGARAYSSNLSTVSTNGGSGTAGEGYGGGYAIARLNKVIGGGGGAGGAGGNLNQQYSDGEGAAGLPLSNSITGSAYNYASGAGGNQLNGGANGNYGSAYSADGFSSSALSSDFIAPSNMGVFILRVPTANFGTVSGPGGATRILNVDYTITTDGTDTILTVFGGNGSANGGIGQQVVYTA